MRNGRRWMGCLLLGMAMGTTRLPAQFGASPPLPRSLTAQPPCQIIDRPTESIFQSDLLYLYRSDVDYAGTAGFLEIGARASLGYFRWPFGDVEARADLRGTWITDSGPIDLPNQLLRLRFPVTWVGRHPDGIATRVRVAPGYHGDMEGLRAGVLYMPVAVSVVRVLTPQWSGVTGLEYRHGFQRQWFPVFGVVWQPAPNLRIEALVPEGMASLALGRDWRFHAGYAWESIDYRLDDPRRRLTIEDLRLTLGVTRVVNAEIEFSGEIGYAVDRRLKFQRPAGNRFDPDNTVFIRFAMATPF